MKTFSLQTSLSKSPMSTMNFSPHREFYQNTLHQRITANSSFNTFENIKKKLIPQIDNKKHIPNDLKKQALAYEETTMEKKSRPLSLEPIFYSLDGFISTHFDDLPLHPSIDPSYVLAGNFAPVDEIPPTACEVVEGSLPRCLDGAYIRNGPNPQFAPRGPYHIFDGDGMLHMITISQGQAKFCCRYVKTYKHLKEREMGYPFFPSIFASFNGIRATMARSMLSLTRILVGHFNPITNGFGTGNTNLALFGGSLFALGESDLPYAVKVTPDGDIVTVGRHDLYSSEPFPWMTAHPKTDHKTGDTFAYRCNFTHPFLTYFRIDSHGRKQPDVHIKAIKKLTIIHDFGITENYAVFADSQIVVNPLDVVRGRSAVGIDAAKVPRVGIIPRYAEDEGEMQWIDTPGLNMFHTVNAWEEDGVDTIVMVGSNPTSVEKVFENLDLARFGLEKITINIKTKTAQRFALSNKVLEFAVINPAYASKKNRYVYAVVIEAPMRAVGVVKLDISKRSIADCEAAVRLWGPGVQGAEPFFVPREPDNPSASEDDGYLVSYVHDGNIGESKFLVMDAKSPNLEIVASVKLPQRVPSGFHGIFLSQNDLNKLY